MRRTNSQTTSTNVSSFTRKIFPASTRGRVAALFILAIVMTAASVATASFAQSKRRARAAAEKAEKREKAEKNGKIVLPQRITYGRSEREREEAEERGELRRERDRDSQEGQTVAGPAQLVDAATRKPVSLKAKEVRLARAHSFDGDLRNLPFVPTRKRERPEREIPRPNPSVLTRDGSTLTPEQSGAEQTQAPELSAPAPAPLSTFEGLDNANWGAGHPPDMVGDVGPNHYIQSINSSVGIYNKATGAAIARFTLDTFMSQGHFGNICDTDNFGDPVILYDTFEDRWVVTDFAFQLNAAGDVSPQVALQCFAVSKTGDPVSGGWNYYSINTTGGLGDYPKLGIWPDGIYMSVNMFGYGVNDSFQNSRVYAFNKAQMYAGAPSVQSVEFNAPSTEFSLLPANARLQTGTPPAGSPNYFTVVAQYLNVISVYKLKADWNNISTSTFTGPFDSLNTTWWAQLAAANQTAPTPGSRNDELYQRLMMQNQYTNIGGVESLWNSMTAGLGNPTTSTTATQSAVRYYQLKVTGGTVEANTSQAFTYSPADTIWRYMPSLAVDRAGNMAMGYTTSNATTHPTITYAGRLATDPLNSITQTDQLLFAGTGSQSGTTRWGDYAAMSLDPDGCTFWFTSEYYATTGLNHQTRVGSFKYPQCTTVGNGTINGTVTANPGGTPVAGATVTLGSRSTNTDANGQYSFNVPAGTYPTMTAGFPGRTTATATTIAVSDGGTTTKDFALADAATSGCLVDTSQADFQAGIPTNTDAVSSAGNVILATSQGVDAQSTTETQAFGFSNTAWFGQTFTPTVTGQATQVALDLFCSTCTGTPPNVVISIRNAAGNLPTGADLASASIPFSNSDAGGFYTATFTTPPTLTAGTQYAIVVRMAAAYSTGTPAYITSTASAYGGGRRTTSNNSGGTWTGTTPDTSFKVTMKTGFKTSGDFVSSLKDANPAAGSVANWGTLSWTATTPAGTTLRFHAAASNSANGPFTYVGPDGTAATFFTSGSSLSQFNGKRYLRYKALYTGTATATPSLADVTVCFDDVPAVVSTALAAAPAAGTYGGTVNLSATLTAGGNGLSGKPVAFTLNGNGVGTGTTDASGVATVSNVSLSGINAGSYASGVGASFAGDSGYSSSTSTAALNVSKASQTITFDPLADKTYGDADFNVSATASSGLAVSFNASGNCTVNGSTVHITGAGSCAVTASQAGDANYDAASDVAQSFNIAKANANVSVTGFTGTYDGSSHAATGTATGAQGEDLASLLDFGASYTNVPGGTAHWTFNESGSNANYNSQSGDVQITISKATPSITWNAPAAIVYGTALGAAQLNASASTAGAFAYTPASGTVLPSGNGQNLHADFTPADSVNYNAASADVSINVLSAVLSVSMMADRNPAPVGLNFNYKATITNTGNASSANTVLTDLLPAQVTFTAASSTQGACSYASAARTVTCNVGSIPASGGSVTVQITVKPRDEGTLNDTASVSAAQWDPAAGGNGSASVNDLPASST